MASTHSSYSVQRGFRVLTTCLAHYSAGRSGPDVRPSPEGSQPHRPQKFMPGVLSASLSQEWAPWFLALYSGQQFWGGRGWSPTLSLVSGSFKKTEETNVSPSLKTQESEERSQGPPLGSSVGGRSIRVPCRRPTLRRLLMPTRKPIFRRRYWHRWCWPTWQRRSEPRV